MLRWVLRMWAWGPPARVGDPLESRFRVLLVDLDILMHMTNGRYLSVLDAARISYYARTGLWRQFRARGWSPVVTAQTITYKRSLTFPRSYQVRTRLVGTDAKNLYFEQIFHIREVEYASAVVSVRLVDTAGASVAPVQVLALDGNFTLPERVPAAIDEWAQFSRRPYQEKDEHR